MVTEHTLNKNPQQQRSTDNIFSGTGRASRAATSTSLSSSTEAGSNNGPTGIRGHEDVLDLRNEINKLMVQEQERPRSPEVTSATQAKPSQMTHVLHSAGEHILKAQAVTVASRPPFSQQNLTMPAFAAPLSPNDLRVEIQAISKQTPSNLLTSPPAEPSSALVEPLPRNDLRAEIQSITRHMKEKGSTFNLSSKDLEKDSAAREKSDYNHSLDRGWDRYRPKYGSRSRSRSRSRSISWSRSRSRRRRRSWSRLRIRSRSRSRGRQRHRTRSDSRGRSRYRGSRSRFRNKTRSESRTRSYKRPRSTSRGRSSSPKARRTGLKFSTSTDQPTPNIQIKASEHAAAVSTKAPPTVLPVPSKTATLLLQSKIPALRTPLLTLTSEPKAAPQPPNIESPQTARGNAPDQATSTEMTEQLATTHGMPGIQSRIDTLKPHGALMAGSDVQLSCPSLTPPKPTSALRKSPSIQDLTMKDEDSDLEIVKLDSKNDSLIILSDDLKPATRTKLKEVYSSGHEAIFDQSQGGTRYFLMRCSSVKEVLEAQKMNIWPTSTLYHDRLQNAFANSTAVRLVFTVHMSREFCGVADMTSAIGWHQQAMSIFDVSKHRQCMKISWISKSTIPYDRILQKLQLPVYAVIFRNGQELPRHIGESVCSELIEQSSIDSRPTEIEID